MKPARPSLMDVIAPPINPWLRKILDGKAADLPTGVRIVRFESDDDGTDVGDDSMQPPARTHPAAAVKERCPA
jgi:hypothetical protein